MKKLIFYLLLLFPFLAYTNPIITPEARISEFQFEENTEWKIELHLLYDNIFFDSICVETESGISKLNIGSIQDSMELYVVTSDSFYTPVSINRAGDCIKVYSYFNENEVTIDSLSFGDYPGSMIDSIPEGYSVCRLSYVSFCKDKSPTIGSPNDTSGTCGTMKGFMYDKNGTIISKGDFIFENTIQFNDDGSYKTRILSRKFSEARITEKISPTTSLSHLIDTLFLNINPDSIVEKDIHFIDYIVGIKDQIPEDFEVDIINYPNPFNLTTNFFIKIPPGLLNREGKINIYNVNGEKINSIEINGSSTVKWNATNFTGNVVSTGIYYYQLLFDNITYKSGSMILLK